MSNNPLTLERFQFIPAANTNMTEQDMAQQWVVDALNACIEKDPFLCRENQPLHEHLPVEWTGGTPKIEVSQLQHALLPMPYTKTEYFNVDSEIDMALKFVYEEGISSDTPHIKRWYSAYYHSSRVPVVACDGYGNLRVNYEQPQNESVFRIEVPEWRKEKTLYLVFKAAEFENYMMNGGDIWQDAVCIYGVGHHPKQLKHHRPREAGFKPQAPRRRYDPATDNLRKFGKVSFT